MVKRICGVIAFLLLSMILISCQKSKYEVVFRDYTGAILKTETVVDGTAATAPANPVREGYNFTGWDVSFDNVTGDIDVKAEYAIKKYEIKFFVDGNLVQGATQQVEHGKSAVLPAVPQKTGYTFTGWVGDYTHVTKAANINAAFDINVYRVTFKDHNGYVIKETHVPHGDDAIAPANPVREGYNFKKWVGNFNNITADTEVVAEYEVKKYEVKFLVDGEPVEGATQQVEHGKNAVLPDAPVKAGYTFTGWVGDYTHVTKAAEINAVFNKNVYKVTFVDYNGYTIKEEHVEHGGNATAPAAPSNKVGYHFKKWVGNFNNITKNTEIVAEYEVNRYTVKFFVDGTLVAGSTQEVEHGKNAVLPAVPQKAGYTFTGWVGNYTNVVAAADINAAFDKNVYKVTFKDYNGYIVKEEYVEHGKSATAPTPDREGYIFDGWTNAYANVTANVVTQAQYTRKQYQIRFLVDGVPIAEATQQVYHGDDAELPNNPGKPGYTFTGWIGNYTNVVGPGDVEADFEKNVYKVTFKDYNGYIIKEEYVEHGESATAPTPSREGYNFDSWTEVYTDVTDNVVTIAQYTRKQYQIRFLVDGVPIAGATQQVYHGDDAELPNNPGKPGYTFTGWIGIYTNVVGPGDVVADFEKNVYKVTFKDYNGYIVKEEYVEHGESATAPTPDREGYTFDGWTEAYTNVTDNVVTIAQYTRKQYQVRFLVDGVPIAGATQQVYHGEDAELPNDPVVMGYTFKGWLGDHTRVVNKIDIVAKMEKNVYRVVFRDWNNYVIKEQYVEHGKNATAPTDPVREGYDFIGWIGTFTNITDETEITANYGIKQYQVTYDVSGGNPIAGGLKDHGTIYELPLPIKEGHTFVCWKVGENNYEAGDDYTVLGAVTFVAQWAIEQDYTLNFEPNGGGEVASQFIRRFNYVEELPTPTRANWDFVGWSRNGEMVEAPFRYTYNENITLLAIWTRTVGGLKYLDEAVDDGITISKYSGAAVSINLGDSLGLEKITRIADDAFNGNTTLKDIVVGVNVLSVGNRAFSNMTKLETISFSNGTQSFANSVFEGSNALTKITLSSKIPKPLKYYFGNDDNKIPASLTTIEYAHGDGGGNNIDKTLTQNNMKNAMLKLASDTTKIDSGRFQQSRIKKIFIPQSVTEIETVAFLASISLTDVIFENGSLLEKIGISAFSSCYSLSNIAIADNANLTTIGKGAFYRCYSLKEMTIPESVTEMGEQVFGRCRSLESLTIPFVGNKRDSVGNESKLGYLFSVQPYDDDGFLYLASGYYLPLTLKEVVVTDATKIQPSAFLDAYKLQEVTVNKGVTEMGLEAFKGCYELTALSLPFIGKNTDPTISLVEARFGHIFGTTEYAAEKTYKAGNYYIPLSLVSVEITDATNIRESAFQGCKSLISIVILDDTVTTIGDHAFRDCTELQAFDIPISIQKIGNSAFRDCKELGHIIIPQTIEYMLDFAFAGCTSLGEVEFDITSSIEEIGASAFSGCTVLEVVRNFPDAVKTIGASAFSDCVNLWSLDYLTTTQLTVIGASAFKNCEFIGDPALVLPKTVKTIGASAFENCIRLEEVSFVLGATLQTVGDSAFKNTPLTSITLPNTTTTIGASAFENCTLLPSITIPLTVETIGASAFENCELLNTVSLHSASALLKIGASAFKGCIALTNFENANDLTEIGQGAFNGCISLSSITLPFVGKSKAAIDNEGKFGYIFGTTEYEGGYNADGYWLPDALETVTIGVRAANTKIAAGAFKNCKKIKDLVIKNDTIAMQLQEIGLGALEGCSGLEKIELAFTGKSYDAIGINTRFGYIFGKTQYLGSYLADDYYIPNNLKHVKIRDKATVNINIASQAFLDCHQIEIFDFDYHRINSIGIGALKGCYGARKLYLGFVGKTRTLSLDKDENRFGYIFGKVSYNYSYNADGFHIPNGLSYVDILGTDSSFEIDTNAFKACAELTHVVISKNADLVETDAFPGCVYLNIFIRDLERPLDDTVWIDGWNSGVTYYCKYEWTISLETGLPTPITP